MLNIPDEVKALFQSDSIFKNFHVHFPNGEHTDLNNENITAESVEFTESLCSQESFRFGLTEASELKFTCVNVPNIRGVTLEAAIEIDVATLGAAWISSHQPSGTEAFLDPQVCTYSGRDLYRVPYGVFIVDTCPRNHETMYKRDVTAYTERLENDSVTNTAQYALMSAFMPGVTTYSPCEKQLANAVLYSANPAELEGAGYTKTQAEAGPGNVTSGAPQNEVLYTVYRTDGVERTLRVREVFNAYNTPYISTSMYGVELTDIGEDAYLAGVIEKLEDLEIDIERSGYSSFEELARLCIEDHAHMFLGVARYMQIGSGTYQQWDQFIDLPLTTTTVYPYGFDAPAPTQILGTAVYVGGAINLTLGAPAPNVVRRYTPACYVYEDTDNSALATQALTISSTLQSKMQIIIGGNTYSYNAFSFANAVSLTGVVEGTLELQCKFGSPARTGGMEITGLDNSAPVSVAPGNYSELWYDETTISPIGYALIKFKGEDGTEQDTTVQIGTGSSIYDLTQNEVLQNTVFTVTDAEAEQGVTVKDKIVDFLNAVFTPNIPDMSFVPIELTKRGLPYLEAGDAIEITTGDAQTVPSFILRQTISGIQFLTADVESANGEAIEVLT